MGVRVTEATDADVPAIAAFFRTAWRASGPDAPGWAGASDEVMAQITAPEAIAARVGGPERRMFLAWEAGRVVGFAATRVQDPETVELAGIVVLPEAIGTGVGTPLLEAAEKSGRSGGATRMTVRTEADNERALGFYRSKGFRATGDVVEQVEGIEVTVTVLEHTMGTGDE